MANKNIETRVLNVVYTTAQLQEEPIASTIISKGLAVYETTIDSKVRLKIGDGVNVYANLPYVSDPTIDEEIMSKIEAMTNIMTIKGTVSTLEELENVKNPKVGDVYFVGSSNTSYAEYIRTNDNTWECIGEVSENIDLSGYYTSSQVDSLILNKADKILSDFVDNGDSSSITNRDTISAAISKLENQIKTKSTNGGGSSVGSEITLNGYVKKTDKSDIVETDTLNSALSKIENKLDDKLDVSDTYTFICTL